jgi:hypothetical protein
MLRQRLLAVTIRPRWASGSSRRAFGRAAARIEEIVAERRSVGVLEAIEHYIADDGASSISAATGSTGTSDMVGGREAVKMTQALVLEQAHQGRLLTRVECRLKPPSAAELGSVTLMWRCDG